MLWPNLEMPAGMRSTGESGTSHMLRPVDVNTFGMYWPSLRKVYDQAHKHQSKNPSGKRCILSMVRPTTTSLMNMLWPNSKLPARTQATGESGTSDMLRPANVNTFGMHWPSLRKAYDQAHNRRSKNPPGKRYALSMIWPMTT